MWAKPKSPAQQIAETWAPVRQALFLFLHLNPPAFLPRHLYSVFGWMDLCGVTFLSGFFCPAFTTRFTMLLWFSVVPAVTGHCGLTRLTYRPSLLGMFVSGSKENQSHQDWHVVRGLAWSHGQLVKQVNEALLLLCQVPGSEVGGRQDTQVWSGTRSGWPWTQSGTQGRIWIHIGLLTSVNLHLDMGVICEKRGTLCCGCIPTWLWAQRVGEGLLPWQPGDFLTAAPGPGWPLCRCLQGPPTSLGLGF
jgi:hypothetical protein